MEKNTTILTWFDPSNPEHMDAWQHLCDEGMWPKNFIPKNFTPDFFPNSWNISLRIKMLDYFMKENAILKKALNKTQEHFNKTNTLRTLSFSEMEVLKTVQSTLGTYKQESQDQCHKYQLS